MFYGKFKDGDADRLKATLKTLEELCGPIYASDNLIGLQRSAGFRADPRFVESLRKTAESQQDASLAWRLHTLVWAAQSVRHLGGDLVECGVWKGFSFAFLADYLGLAGWDQQVYLYDTYQGIPEALNSENRSNAVYEKQISEDPDAIYRHVQDRFASCPNVHVVRGIVPDIFAETCPDRIALLHVDMNSTASEIAALEGLFDRMVPGGMIVFDDYGWTGYSAQRVAEDDWMAKRGHHILELPTGQGLVIRQ